MDIRLPPVYPITDKTLSGKPTHLAILRELARGGASWVQIRDKVTPDRELAADLLRCVEFAAARGIRLIVDDRCDLALVSGAAGVHLGQTDLPPEAARRIIGRRRIIGFSTHTPAQVRAARRMPVDYLGFGPVFGTTTKENAEPPVGLEGLKIACRMADKPVVAIGGIGPGRIRAVLDAGASSAAVISALMGAPDIARRMEELLREATATG